MPRFSGLSRLIAGAASQPVALVPKSSDSSIASGMQQSLKECWRSRKAASFCLTLVLFDLVPVMWLGWLVVFCLWPLVRQVIGRLLCVLLLASGFLDGASSQVASGDGTPVAVEIVFSDVSAGAFHEAMRKIVDLIRRYKAAQQSGKPSVPHTFYVRILFTQHMLTSALNEIDLLNAIVDLLEELPHASNPVLKFAIVIARAECHLYNQRDHEFKACLKQAERLFQHIAAHYEESIVSFCRAPYNSCRAAKALHDGKPWKALELANAVAAGLKSQSSTSYITALIDVALCCMMCGPEAARVALGALSEATHRIKTAFGKSNSDARRLLEARVGMLNDLFGFYVCHHEGLRRRELLESYKKHLKQYKSVLKNACRESNSEWVFFCLHHLFMCAELGEPLPHGLGASLLQTFRSIRESHDVAVASTTRTPWMPRMPQCIMFRFISPRPSDPLLLSCLMASDHRNWQMVATPQPLLERHPLLPHAAASSSSSLSGGSSDSLQDTTTRSPSPACNNARRSVLVNVPEFTPMRSPAMENVDAPEAERATIN